MSSPRTIMFVDGENIVLRYQSMLDSGEKPIENVIHEPDCFLWHGDMTGLNDLNLLRVCYYTSVAGDDKRIVDVRERISSTGFRSKYINSQCVGQIVPFVYKKRKKSQKSRHVDIQIVIDIMSYAFSDSIDRIILASGDGDYLPLLKTVMQRGKQVIVEAFSSGLNSEIPSSVDRFISLDNRFFKK